MAPKSKYVTAGVIRDTHDYVKKTQWQWPASWEDLGSEDFSDYTRIRFDIDPMSATRQAIMSAISTGSGRYLTYPDADRHLEAVFDELIKYRQGTTESGD